ncbi:MAG: hypothetical protein K2X86_00365 [Cytophagaceae bacterium]|nr:hypothetical protein [Cytophagaceae bacterium]
MVQYSKLVPVKPSEWPSRFEEFGVSYLKKLKEQDENLIEITESDEVIAKKVRSISMDGILLSALAGFISAFISVYVDETFKDADPIVHYGWLASITAMATGIEMYLLFLIALKTVYKIAGLSNIKFTRDENNNEFPFSIEKILARTALELSDPKQDVLGIDAFKRVPNYKLILYAIAYKLKIVFSNILVRSLLKRIFGRSIMRISVNYLAAVPITGLWNAMVLHKVAREARLRIFGYVLSNNIANKIVNRDFLSKLSPEAKTGCIRAIANAVVLTRNYHPNMILLLLRFKDLLQIEKPDEFDDWDRFINTLNKVSDEEKYMLLDILTISAAFDGRVSRMEKKYLKEAYGEYYDVYFQRLLRLTSLLRQGKLQECISLCKIDFIPG